MLEDIRTFAKLFAVLAVLLALGLIGSAAALVLRDPQRLRRFRARALSRGARIGRGIFGLRDAGASGGLGASAGAGPLAAPGALLVSNHLSYLDIVAIAARQPTVFITSVEVRETPVVGWLTRAMGCLYVERRTRAFLPREVREIAAVLESGLSVTLFPEGTSSDGREVLPFKAALLDAARDAQAAVAPICLSYSAIDGRAFGPVNHRVVCYYGDDRLGPHLLRLLRMRRIDVRLERLPILRAQDMRNRYELAAALHDGIAARFPGYFPGAAEYIGAMSAANCVWEMSPK